MTWRMSSGERVLNQAEAKLYASALASMIDLADDSGEGLNFGIPLVQGAFERLSDSKKFTVLEEVTRALLKPTGTCPELTAVNESAIYYVFQWLKNQFEDVETGEEVWGQLVLDALGPAEDGETDEFRPSIGCGDLEKWDFAMEELADRILWDRDFEMEEELQGGANVELMDRMRIDRGYYEPYQGAAERGAKRRLYDMVRAISG